MALELSKVKLTAAEKKAAEKTLQNWGEMNKGFAERSIGEIRKLLAYELATRARLTVVQRLTVRYGVLEARENEREVAKYLARRG